MNSETPLLTLSQVKSWETRCEELRSTISISSQELDLLTRKIEAAKLFIDLLPQGMVDNMGQNESSEPSEDMGSDDLADESISQTVLAAVAALKGSAKAAVIREWISANNPTASSKLVANPAYLYTSLMRHVRAGRLAKRGKNYRLPKLQSSLESKPGTDSEKQAEITGSRFNATLFDPSEGSSSG